MIRLTGWVRGGVPSVRVTYCVDLSVFESFTFAAITGR